MAPRKRPTTNLPVLDTAGDVKLMRARIADSGIQVVLDMPHYKNWIKRQIDFHRQSTAYDEDNIWLVVHRSAVADIVQNDLYWMTRWVTEKRYGYRVEKIHKMASDFFKFGPSILPEEYLKVGQFQYRPNILKYKDNMGYDAEDDFAVKMLIIPRGLAKTTQFHVLQAIQRYMKDPFSKWLMVHGNKEKAKDNLKQLRQFLSSKYLELIRPDIFAIDRKEYIDRGGKITSEKINIAKTWYQDEEIMEDVRRESTFFVGSPGMDLTGMHPDGEFDDDLVIAETSSSLEATDKLEQYYRNNFALANIPGRYFRFITGTFWYEQSLYHRLFNDERISYFRMPAWWYEQDGKTRTFVSNFFNEEVDAQMRSNFKEWYEPHMCIAPKPFSNEKIDFRFNESRDYLEMGPDQLRMLKNKGCSIQVCDPAYSSKNKREGDRSSRFTITQFVVHEDVVYITDCWQSMGEDYENIIKHNLIEAEKNDIDYFIQDAQGTQGTLYDAVVKELRLKNPYLRDFKHSNPGLTQTKGKIEVANAVLKEYFQMGCIKIVKGAGTRRVYEQITGHDRGMDIIDTLVYLMADFYPDRASECLIATANRKRKKDRKMKEKYKMDGKSFNKLCFKGFG